jgi:glycine betaine/proline transport system substrate-binding protein
MRSILRVALWALALLCATPTAFSQDAEIPVQPACGTQPLAIAKMAWTSAALLAEIHARILTAEFGCTVRVVPGDLAASASSMATTGQPAVAPEMWIARIADIWNSGVKGQNLRPAGPSFADGALEGWFVPDYVAADHPGLVSAASLKDFWPVFANGGKKGRFISCPPDWGCAIINRNMLKANGLGGLFDIVEPANRFEMDRLIAEAVSRKEPILFYYWHPNAVLAQFSFKALDLGGYNKDDFACLGKAACAAPRPSGFAPEPVVIAVAEWVFTDIPHVASYFQRAAMPIAEMDKMLLALNGPEASVETVAARFIAERGEIWRPWVGATTP